MKPVTGWSSTNEGLWPIPQGVYRWILYISARYQGDEQKSHLELRNVIYFPINISINKVIPNSFPESGGVEMKLTSCPGINLVPIDPSI